VKGGVPAVTSTEIDPVEPPLHNTSVVDVVNCGAGGTYAYIAELLDPQEFVAFTLIGPEKAPKSTVMLPVLSPEAIDAPNGIVHS
jgi:hypothetical protein